jgi:RNA polymerase sigma-70 factor (ECF subfamily)
MTPLDEPVRPPPNSDSLLVQRCLDGDKRAFDLLVIKYQRRVERLIGRMVRDVDAVPDIAQETFIRAYRALPQYRGDAQFYTWLYRIAVNTAKKRLMVMKRDPLVFAPDTVDEDGDETSSVWREPRGYSADNETPEAVLASREIAQAVNDAMAALPAMARTSKSACVTRSNKKPPSA